MNPPLKPAAECMQFVDVEGQDDAVCPRQYDGRGIHVQHHEPVVIRKVAHPGEQPVDAGERGQSRGENTKQQCMHKPEIRQGIVGFLRAVVMIAEGR